MNLLIISKFTFASEFLQEFPPFIPAVWGVCIIPWGPLGVRKHISKVKRVTPRLIKPLLCSFLLQSLRGQVKVTAQGQGRGDVVESLCVRTIHLNIVSFRDCWNGVET